MKNCDKLAVTVCTTNICNLRCEYCIAASGKEQINPKVIDVNFAKKGIKDALEGYPTGTKAKILRFYSGGEPTQAFRIIKECVEYAHLLDPSIRTELQINGLFLSKEITLWIRDNISVVWFSLDGLPEINDKNRPDKAGKGRTKEIEENLKLVMEKSTIGIRSTIIKEVVNKQHLIVEYYSKLGIKNLAFNPVFNPVERNSQGNMGITSFSIMDFAKGFLVAHKRANELGINLLSSLTCNFDEPTSRACWSCIPMPQLNVDGSVSSCDLVLYRDTKEEMKPFLYGEWDKDNKKIIYDMDKINYLRKRKLENLPKCKDCEVASFCAGGCLGGVAYEKGDMYDIIETDCEAIKYLAKNIPLGEKKLTNTHP
jgi:radical SAM protein with 4Fe4S-binding SPASM domain